VQEVQTACDGILYSHSSILFGAYDELTLMTMKPPHFRFRTLSGTPARSIPRTRHVPLALKPIGWLVSQACSLTGTWSPASSPARHKIVCNVTSAATQHRPEHRVWNIGPRIIVQELLRQGMPEGRACMYITVCVVFPFPAPG
jgi:hypothetical protein